MRELSREASELLDAGRSAFRPSNADRARVLAAITGAATLAGGAAVASAAKLSWFGYRWTQVLAFALPMAAGGAYLGSSLMGSAAMSLAPPPPSTPALVSKLDTAAPVEVTPPTLEPSAAPAVTVPSAKPAPTPLDSPKPGPQIGQEVALLSKAQAELSGGRASQALSALAEHAQRFPRGALAEERMATRARALCALGRMAEAEAELNRVERRNPGSAYLPRAREACRK
jgi:hypothetical protein